MFADDSGEESTREERDGGTRSIFRRTETSATGDDHADSEDGTTERRRDPESARTDATMPVFVDGRRREFDAEDC